MVQFVILGIRSIQDNNQFIRSHLIQSATRFPNERKLIRGPDLLDNKNKLFRKIKKLLLCKLQFVIYIN